MKNEFTIMLPVHRSNIPLANECLTHLLNVCDLNIILVDDHGNDGDYVNNERIKFIHNTFPERQPLVKIWNQCIKECPTEYVIIASWRQRPTPDHFKIIKERLDEGFGIVTFDGLHFFSFSKHLTTVMGFFDEGFKSGQYEDSDWLLRLRTNNIAMYFGDIPEQRIIHGQYINSMWLVDGHLNEQYYKSKWEQNPSAGTITQHKEEVNYSDREIYKNVYRDRVYKTWDQSVLDKNSISFFGVFKNFPKTF